MKTETQGRRRVTEDRSHISMDNLNDAGKWALHEAAALLRLHQIRFDALIYVDGPQKLRKRLLRYNDEELKQDNESDII